MTDMTAALLDRTATAVPLTAAVLVLAHATAAQDSPTLLRQPERAVRDTRGGNGAAFQINSAILKQTRHINLVLPPSFERTGSARRYPVIVVLDGEGNLAPAAAVMDELTRGGLIPESILVAIENEDPFRGRVQDLTPPGLSVSGSGLSEGGDVFLDFIEKELLPAVDRQFRGGLPRALVGHSSGGILATYAAATRPAFRAVVAIDTPVTLGDNWLAERLIARARSDRTPLRFAAYEARFPWPAGEWAALQASAPASWRVHRETLAREGHETAFMISAYLGLREVFGEYSRLAAPETPTTSRLPYYRKLSDVFGVDMIPPRRVLRDVVEDLIMEGRGASARQAYTQLESAYGAPPDAVDLRTQIAEVERNPEPTETVEGLLSTPAPSPEEARAYLGDWTGESWQNPDAPHQRVTLHVKVEDGKVVADLENPRAPEEFRVRRMQYLKVTPNGLTFGIMNGMRPRGMILYEGIRSGDRLAGKQRWGGIRFDGIKGAPPSDPGFAFERVRR
jgi:putative esterase